MARWVVAALVATLGGCEAQPEHRRVFLNMSPRLEDAADVERRALIELDARLAAYPEDEPHRERLLAYYRDQILVEDMAEGRFRETRYGLGLEEGVQ